MKQRHLFRFVAVLMVCSAAASTYLLAQGTDLGTIRGTVTDASGAVVPKAKVIILDLAETDALHIVALAAAILALGIVYWLISDSDPRLGRDLRI